MGHFSAQILESSLHLASHHVGQHKDQTFIDFLVQSSQDLFHDAIFSIFGDIPYCFNQQDDILIGGVIVADHYRTI